MRVLLYQGRSWVSRAIRWQTRSPYSHAALMMDDCLVYEAWHIGGVRRILSPFSGHADGTEIDVFGIKDVDEGARAQVELFLVMQLGKRYDYGSVARFVSRRQTRDDDKWFCSELVLSALNAGGIQLLRIKPSLASPRDLSISPRLIYEKTLGN